jgi:hypothetical protein
VLSFVAACCYRSLLLLRNGCFYYSQGRCCYFSATSEQLLLALLLAYCCAAAISTSISIATARTDACTRFIAAAAYHLCLPRTPCSRCCKTGAHTTWLWPCLLLRVHHRGHYSGTIKLSIIYVYIYVPVAFSDHSELQHTLIAHTCPCVRAKLSLLLLWVNDA